MRTMEITEAHSPLNPKHVGMRHGTQKPDRMEQGARGFRVRFRLRRGRQARAEARGLRFCLRRGRQVSRSPIPDGSPALALPGPIDIRYIRIYSEVLQNEVLFRLSVAHHRRMRSAVQALLHLFRKRLQEARRHDLGADAEGPGELPGVLPGVRPPPLLLHHGRRPDPAPGLLAPAGAAARAADPVHDPGESLPPGRRGLPPAEGARLREVPALPGRHGKDA